MSTTWRKSPTPESHRKEPEKEEQSLISLARSVVRRASEIEALVTAGKSLSADLASDLTACLDDANEALTDAGWRIADEIPNMGPTVKGSKTKVTTHG